MKIFKFGGASVYNAEAVRNIAYILSKYENDKIMVVISAMGKTTNALEELTKSFCNDLPSLNIHYSKIKKYHVEIISTLFEKGHLVFSEVNELFEKLLQYINKRDKKEYDFEYDQIVSYGEFFSTKIISHYLNDNGITNKWFSVYNLIKTDDTHREGRINWPITKQRIKKELLPYFAAGKIAITQGFVASTLNNTPITLGREGSDFTASVFANILDADEVVVWKDVPGLLNADPKYYTETIKLDRISYLEAIELVYYGAKVLHPKSIKPLQNKDIPLKVKSFISPDGEGSVIHTATEADSIVPSYIFKDNQVLISISTRDFSFVAEQNLSYIFSVLAKYGMKVNLMQNSAVSFSVCVDSKKTKLPLLIKELQSDYKVRYNTSLELITIRHYDQPTIDKVVGKRKILLEQKSRSTVQVIVSNSRP